jgi:small subunit ribosomal protein S1
MAPKIELDIRPIILYLLDSKLVLKSELGVLHMTDDFFDENNDEEQESFASLLDSYSPSTNRELRVGDKVVGKIISIGKDAVFVDTGTKIDGVVDKTELLDENGELPLKDGDEIELFIVTLTEDEIKLSKAISGIGGLYMLQEAHAKAVPVEGRVLETCKGGFRVEILQRKAFCPISQIDVEYVENPVDYVGAKHQFLITQLFEENGRNIVVSRRILLAQELAAARKLFYESVSVGQVLAGKVTRLMPYGACVEISAGVEGKAPR